MDRAMKCHWEKCLDLATVRLRWLDDGAEAVYCDAHDALARMHGAVPTSPGHGSYNLDSPRIATRQRRARPSPHAADRH
jgi:hypothetical protein